MAEKAFDNVVIRASAGSGKTFKLSNRYLALLFLGVAPETILATTFTRKAAGEIQARVLSRLAKAALTPDGAKQLAQELTDDLGDKNSLEDKKELVTQERALDILTSLAPKLHQLRISTIDALFSQLAGCFALELGLSFGWRIVDESADNRLRDQAILEVFSKIDWEESELDENERKRKKEDKKESNKYAKTLFYHLFKGESARSLSYEIRGLIRDLIGIFRETKDNPLSWGNFPSFDDPTEEEIQKNINLLAQAPLPRTKPRRKNEVGKIRSSYLRCHQDLMDAIADKETRNWESFLKNPFVQRILMNIEKYDREEIPDEIVRGVKFFIPKARAVLLATFINQTKATRELFEKLVEIYDHLKEEEGAYQFDDIANALSEAGKHLGPDSWNHRIDSQTDHILLDEFQDTSLNQWSIIEPMAAKVTEGTSETVLLPDGEAAVVEKTSGVRSLPDHPTSLFCVGDTKQSIYAWRGGEPEIFNEVEAMSCVVKQHLDKSWRSSPVIMEGVNHLFGKIKTHLPKTFSSDEEKKRKFDAVREAAQKWQDAFIEHSSAKELTGYLSLEEAPPRDKEIRLLLPWETNGLNGYTDEFSDEDSENSSSDDSSGGEDVSQGDLALAYAVERIEQIYQRTPGASIGVLVRNRNPIQKLIRGLANKGIKVSLEGGVPLIDAKSVQAVLATLTLADHPGDSLAYFYVSRIPVLTQFLKRLDGQERQELPLGGELSRLIRNRLMTEGLGKFVRRICQEILSAGLEDEQESALLESLYKSAFQFQAEAENRVDKFVSFIQKARTEIPSASRVRIMTIHGSKGLEFDTVVLPELGGELIRTRNNKILVDRPKLKEPIQSVLRWVKSDLQPILPDNFLDALHRKISAEVKESLNLLYVAMTRAARELIMIVPGGKKNDKGEVKKSLIGLRYSNLLKAAFQPEAAEPESEEPESAKSESAKSESAKSESAKSESAKSESAETTAKENKAKAASEPSEETKASQGAAEETSKISEPPKSFLEMGKVLYENGDPCWYAGEAKMLQKSSAALPIRRVFARKYDGQEMGISEEQGENAKAIESSMSPSSRSFERKWMPQTYFRRGTVIHALFEQVGWIEDGIPPQEVLEEAVRKIFYPKKILYRPEYVKEEIKEFRRMSEEIPAIRKLLSKASYPAESELFCERAFLFAQDDNGDEESIRPIAGVMDRLVLIKEGDKVVRADIIDYKTDRGIFSEKIKDKDLSHLDLSQITDGQKAKDFVHESKKGLFDHYCSQLRGYRAIAANAFSLSPADISAHLAFLSDGLVIDITPLL